LTYIILEDPEVVTVIECVVGDLISELN